MMRKFINYLMLLSCFVTCDSLVAEEAKPEALAIRPRVAGTLQLRQRTRREVDNAPGGKRVVEEEKVVAWETAETAIVIIDMWDGHYCRSAAQRVGVMAPRMNQVVTAARNHGGMMIHSPSGVTDMYADTPYRKRMQQAPAATAPKDWPFTKWCDLDTAREPPLPIDTSRCPCDDPIVGAAVKQFSKQHPALDITGYDGMSDNAREIFNFCEANGIKNIVVMGVHTNMCILGRPFGIRALVGLGRNVVLVRDLTDAMYDPREPPYVSHTRGTELVVEHIERYWCPSILADDLTIVAPGSAGP